MVFPSVFSTLYPHIEENTRHRLLALADSGGGAQGARAPPFEIPKRVFKEGQRGWTPPAPPLLKFQRGSSNGTATAPPPPLSTNPGSAPGWSGQKSQKLILQDLFEPSANDTFKFDQLAHPLQSKFEEDVPLFTPYFRDKLLPAIREHHVVPHQKQEHIPLNWKNNNCEAINHLLKLETNWKPEEIPDLIEKIHRIVPLQFTDIRRALHGQGNFTHTVAHVNWTYKTEKEKTKLFKDFMSYRSRKRPAKVTSTDGKPTGGFRVVVYKLITRKTT